MASSMAAALESLYADLEGMLMGLVPDAKPTHRFARRQPQDEQLRAITSITGRARLFEIREAALTVTRLVYTGAGSSGIEVSVPIDVLYPAADPGDAASWAAAAISDWSAFHHLCYTASTATAVQARTCEATPVMSPLENDPWFLMTMTVVALLDVEQ